ncbi:hypothetical protein Tco_0830029 [Tanacetum coccineum]
MWRASGSDVPRALPPTDWEMPRISFWKIPGTKPEPAQNRSKPSTEARSYLPSWIPITLVRLRDEMMLTQYESTPEFGSGSGGCGDDEIADDEDGGEDEEDEEDGDS